MQKQGFARTITHSHNHNVDYNNRPSRDGDFEVHGIVFTVTFSFIAAFGVFVALSCHSLCHGGHQTAVLRVVEGPLRDGCVRGLTITWP